MVLHARERRRELGRFSLPYFSLAWFNSSSSPFLFAYLDLALEMYSTVRWRFALMQVGMEGGGEMAESAEGPAEDGGKWRGVCGGVWSGRERGRIGNFGDRDAG